MQIHPSVWGSLGYYVYAYVDPRDDSIRYIGKGKGDRALAHLSDEGDSEKTRWIKRLNELNINPRIDILARNLSEKQSFRIERTLIDAIGIGENRLTNKVRGQGVATGREPISEIAIKMNPEPLIAHHELMIVRLNKHYRPGLTNMQLYDLSRGVWGVGNRREEVEVVLAMSQGIIRGVYIPQLWHKAGTTEYSHVPRDDVDSEEFKNRWEFTGIIAPPEISKLYLGKDASSFFKRGNANSFGYISPEPSNF
jgi:hypothetical protein|tara:strand:- start:1394 stop:2149 length:756 start_codon:yes stop_codon:yes gene_type:complete